MISDAMMAPYARYTQKLAAGKTLPLGNSHVGNMQQQQQQQRQAGKGKGAKTGGRPTTQAAEKQQPAVARNDENAGELLMVKRPNQPSAGANSAVSVKQSSASVLYRTYTVAAQATAAKHAPNINTLIAEPASLLPSAASAPAPAAAASSSSSPGPLTSDDTLPLEEASSSSVANTDNVHSDSTDSLTNSLSTVSLASSSSSSSGGERLPPPTPQVLSQVFTGASPLVASSTASDEAEISPSATLALPRSSWTRSLPSHLTLPEEQEDILLHLLAREEKSRVQSSYMMLQPELNEKMREILLDWLHGVAHRFRLKSESYLSCAMLLDRFLSVRECAREKFQLVGITCLIVAAKYEETVPPSLEDFIVVTDRAFARSAIRHMEGVILASLGFEMTVPTVASFLGLSLMKVPMDDIAAVLAAKGGAGRDAAAELKHWVSFFTLLSVQHASFLVCPPSMLAAGFVALAHFQLVAECHALTHGTAGAAPALVWDDALIAASGGYTSADLAGEVFPLVARALEDMSDQTPGAKYNSVIKRFQREQYGAVANRKVVFPTM